MASIDSILEERGTTYGAFEGISAISQTLKDTLRHGMQSNCSDDMTEALEMICHKMARIINGDPNHLDSWMDIAGYATLVARRLESEHRDK